MKQVTLQCPPDAVEMLRRIIVFYTDAAYPPGGSECAQSARESLLNAADSLKANYNRSTSQTYISRRIRAHVSSAIEYYFRQHPDESEQRQRLLSGLLDGQTVMEQDWND